MIIEGRDYDQKNNLTEQGRSPVEALDPSKTSAELLDFTRQLDRRGHLRFVDASKPEEVLQTVKRKYFRFLVTMHEVGHKVVAQALGWVVKTFTAMPGPGYEGKVEVVPPTGISQQDYLTGLGKIAAAGQEAIGSKMGAGSDDVMVDFASRTSALGRSSLHSSARMLMHSDSMMRALTWEHLPEAA